MPNRIEFSGRFLDLSPRLFASSTVAASPALAAETTIATITIDPSLAVQEGVLLFGWAAFTVGTSGVSAKLNIRQTNTSGTVVASSGAITETAANLDSICVVGVDASPPAAGVYVLTLTVASGAAVSTVSAVELAGLVV